jgi:hypothetical protein
MRCGQAQNHMPKIHHLWALTALGGFIIWGLDFWYYQRHPRFEIIEIMMDEEEVVGFKQKTF